MTSLPTHLIVSLGDTAVGRLSLDVHGAVDFRLLNSYKALYPRPVLGQIFLDDLDRIQRHRTRLPPWFANLLPEGALRQLLERQLANDSVTEFALLHQLGRDLPGDVRLRADEGSEDIQVASTIEAQPPEAGSDWKFSLAGVQLKFSAHRSGRGLTIPLSGIGGEWIAKLPDARFPEVPANEYATMHWAGASGIQVPATCLVDMADIEGLPSEALAGAEHVVYAVHRFDRPAAGQRVHIEDFAQVLGVYPERKYDSVNYETLGRLILTLAGRVSFDEFLRRLVFIVACGNGDAHLKNWSLLYSDPISPVLSPAYDLVSTIQYMPGDGLALNLARSKHWSSVSMASFERLARKLELSEADVKMHVLRAVSEVRAAWRQGNKNFGFSTHQCDVIERHMASVPLLN